MNAERNGWRSGAVERARRADLGGIHRLLTRKSLPSADIIEESLDHFFVYRDEVGIAGVVGLEPYEDVALLRSLVVADNYAGRGVGRRLVTAVEELALKLCIRRIYLLTTTAEAYFEYFGYRVTSRDTAPIQVRQCSQFKSLCPSTAVLMVKQS
jgi:amino-acid N-acetyltransferase